MSRRILPPQANIEALLRPVSPEDFFSEPIGQHDYLEFDVVSNGIIGSDKYRGNYLHADVRAPAYNKKQDLVVNRQSVSFVEGRHMDAIAAELNLDPDIIQETSDLYNNIDRDRIPRLFLAQCLGASILFDHFPIDQLANKHPLAVVDFGPYNTETRKFSDAVVQIARPNPPCISAGQKIKEHYPASSSDLPKQFVNVAQGRRGYVGSVVKSGKMSPGDRVSFVPLGND